jgi:CubicO group peptidase (beta-lactamase class C family)
MAAVTAVAMLALAAADWREALQPYRGPHEPAICVLVLSGERLNERYCVGWADREKRIAATPSTNFRLASLTKQFTAAAILRLAERNRLQLDDSIRRWLPELPAWAAPIQIRHLLTHQSGLPDYEDHLPAGDFQVKDADVVQILVQQPGPRFAPGEKFAYSNSGYAVLARIVEAASGQRFPEFVGRQLLARAHMRNSMAFEEGVSPMRNRAFGYSPANGGWVRTDQSRTSAVLGDGGIYSNLDDLARWLLALDRGDVLKPESRTAAFTAVPLRDGAPTEYGYGWFVRGVRTWHTGETIGFRNAVVRDPERKRAVVVLSNRANLKARELAETILASP